MGVDADTIKTIVTAYAAVVATASLAWNIVVYRRDRAELKVEGTYSTVHRKTRRGLRSSGPPVLTFTITNVGRRPITVTNFGGSCTGEDSMFTVLEAIPQPVKLDEGETVSVALPIDVLDGVGGKKTGFHVRDSTGRYWKLAPEAFMAMAGAAKEYFASRAAVLADLNANAQKHSVG